MHSRSSLWVSLFFGAASLGAVSCTGRSGDASGSGDAPAPVTSSGSSAGVSNTGVGPSVSPAVAPRAPSLLSLSELDEDERVSASDPLPAAPPEPVPSPSIAPQVRALSAIVARTSECWTTSPEMRIYHAAPADCSEWFDALARGGEASAFAIGQHLGENVHAINDAPFSRLVEILASTEAQAAVPFLLRRMHASVAYSEAAQRQAAPSHAQPMGPWVFERVVSAFERTTGFPVNVSAPWTWAQDDRGPKDRATAQRALLFWERNGTNAAQWPTLSEQRLRAWLAADEARVVRAASIVLERSASASLVAVARQALERLEATTRSAEARAAARALLARTSDGRPAPARPSL